MRENQADNKKTISIIISILVLLSLLMIFTGGSYAFFTFAKTGSKINTVTLGTFQIVYETGSSAINLANAYPMTDTEGKATDPYIFTIKNNGSVPALYQVDITEDATSNLTRTLLKYTLKRNSEEESAPIFLNLLNLKTNITLAAGVTDTYQLKIWLDQSATNEIQGKIWKGKISITATE